MTFEADAIDGSTVATKACVGIGTRVEWCGSQVGTSRIGTPVVWFDNGSSKSDLVAITFFHRALGTFTIGWNEKGWATNALCAIVGTCKFANEFSSPTSSREDVQQQGTGNVCCVI